MPTRNRCRHRVSPESSQYGSWVCIRPTWKGTGSCIWHAKESNKPFPALSDALQSETAWAEEFVLGDVYLNNQQKISQLEFESGVFLSPNFKEVDFSYTEFSEIEFQGGELIAVDFTGTKFEKLNVIDSTVDECIFKGIRSPNVHFERGRWTKTKLTVDEISGEFIDIETFQGNRLSGDFVSVNFKHLDIWRSNISDSRFSECNFRGFAIRETAGFRVKMSRVDFENGALETVPLCDSDITSPIQFDHVRFDNVWLKRSDTDSISVTGNKSISGLYLDAPETTIGALRIENIQSADGLHLSKAEINEIEIMETPCTNLHCEDTDPDLICFNHVDIDEGKFNRITPNRIVWSEVELNDIEGREVRIPGSQATDFQDVIFSGGDWSGLRFKPTNLNSISFEGTTLIGARFGGLEPTGTVILNQTSLMLADLSEAHLEKADLQGANLCGADLSGAVFRNADLRDTVLWWANLADADLRGVRINQNTEFDEKLVQESIADALIENRDLHAVLHPPPDGIASRVAALLRQKGRIGVRCWDRFWRASRASGDGNRPLQRLRAQWVGLNARIDEWCTNWRQKLSQMKTSIPILGTKSEDDDNVAEESSISSDASGRGMTDAPWVKDEAKLTEAVHIYRSLQQVYRENGIPEQARKYRIRERHARRKRYLTAGRRFRWAKAASMRWSAGYLERWRPLLAWSGLTIVGCAFLYLHLGGIRIYESDGRIYAHAPPVLQEEIASLPQYWIEILASLYFSVVTFTTLGYGDAQPVGAASKFIAGVESLIGVIVMAILVFILGRRATW